MMDIGEVLSHNSEDKIAESAIYMAEQQQELLLGKEEGLNVSSFSNPEFHWLQMEQIRMGLKDKIDVSIYADPTYSYETMKQIRLSMYSANDLLPYLDRGFVDGELEQIRLALEDTLPIDEWITDDMYMQQIYEIRIGLYEGIKVSAYADSRYNWMQMKEIRLGLEKKLNVSQYTNHLFNHWQMKEIRLGLEAGLDTSSYAKLIFSATDMKKCREELLQEKFSAQMTPDKLGIDMSAFTKKEFNLFVEDNGNKVYGFMRVSAGNAITEDDIYAALKKRRIVAGIKREAITDMIQKRRVHEKILIAEGIPAEDGQNGWYEFFVRLDLPRIPAPLPDGGVDYANIEAFEMVEEGEKIAVYHPAGKGVDGKNVFGETLHANPGVDKKPLKGTGFIIKDDKVTYVSKLNGKFEYRNGRIIITNMVVVREDVTAVTGKLEVDGSVHVIGSVYSGGYISATGDIIIEYNVQAARLIAGGNVMIKKGSCSKNECFIEAKGDVSGSFFEAATIEAGGNVSANYIMNSTIHALGKVVVSGSKGMLLGGRICAVRGVDTYNLGNSSNIKTFLDVGQNADYEKKQALLAAVRSGVLDELQILEEKWNKVLQCLPPDKATAELLIRSLNVEIVSKQNALADLDAEMSRLNNLTKQGSRAVIVRGNAYEGCSLEINRVKYVLSGKANRVIFELRGKKVVMVR